MPGQDELTEKCKTVLNDEWTKIASAPLQDHVTDPMLREAIKKCVNSEQIKSYRYVLPTQVLAKLVNSSLDARSLQRSSNLPGAFDARSLNKQVIVPFDRTNQNVLGGSPEPYVNNPLRVRAVTAAHREQQADKDTWDALCMVLEAVETKQDPAFTQAVFRQVLTEIHRRLGQTQFTYAVPRRVSQDQVLNLIGDYLSEGSGGERPLAIAAALFETIADKTNLFVRVRHSATNVSDAATGQVADIDCLDDGNIVLSAEVKDQELTAVHIEEKMKKAREKGVENLIFLAPSVKEEDREKVKHIRDSAFASGLNINVLTIQSLAEGALALMGDQARVEFLHTVGSVLERHTATPQDRKAWANLLSKL